MVLHADETPVVVIADDNQKVTCGSTVKEAIPRISIAPSEIS